MLGFAIPEHDAADAAAADAMNLSHGLTSPDRDWDWDLTSPSASEGWVDWRAGQVLGGTSVTGTEVGTGEYVGDGTIDPSVLGGSADKADEYASTLDCRFRGDGGAERAMNEGDVMDDEEEEDVMCMLFENVRDKDFLPPSGSGKGKGNGCRGQRRRVSELP